LKPGPLAIRIAQSIADAERADFAPLATERVAGGCIHEAWKLTGATSAGERAVFVKTNAIHAKPMFAAEREGLDALDALGKLRVPRRITCEDDGEQAWLGLEWLELEALAPASAAALGEALAAQHAVRHPRFGWARDNFIGASPQRNGWSDDWLEFWRERRLVAQLRMAASNRLPSKMIDRGERLAADCGVLMREHRPHASLLHGDLWGGNAAALHDGTPVVFDPAVYLGDREADLAMTELFGGFAPDFHSAYRTASPLGDGYAVRRDFYNLYHVLNHANLFAGGYVGQAEQSIARLLAEIA
jgi:protein-ribulosamine 3-kinase